MITPSRMPVEELAAKYLDAWQRHDVEEIIRYHTPDSVFSSKASGRAASGLKAVRETIEGIFKVWPDLHFRTHRVYTTPELIVTESTAEATQALPMAFGDTLVQPTGRRISFEVADIFALENGLIKRKESYYDALAYVQQMRKESKAEPGILTKNDLSSGANGKAGRQPIPQEAQDLIASVELAYIATVRPDGLPNLSPKGTLKVVDEYTLAFGDIASPETMRNLEHCPHVEVNVVDVFRRRGFRFRGRAKIVDDSELIAFLSEGLGEIYPMKRAVRIAVEETRPLISPIYWLMDASEADVIRKWERRLGYQRIPAQARP